MAYTKRIYFKAIENYFNTNKVEIPANVIKNEGELQDNITSEDILNFVRHEIELLDNKKSSNTKTKTQIENENIKNVIVDTLTDLAKFVTISELQNANEELANLSNQKISALLKQLADAEIVKRQVDKKKAYFGI